MYYLCYALLYCIIFAFGAAIGSFLNVCIYRLPKEESLWRNNSHCMTCGTPIRKRDLIPIFSWCRLRGKCHSCGAKIPFRYTLVESLNAVLYVLIYAYFGIFDRPLYAGLVCLFCSALVVVFFMDLDTQLINLYVLGFIGLLGIAATVYDVCTGNSTLLSHLIGAAAASVPLFLLVILSGERAMGRGDAELMLVGGLFLGVKGVVVGLFLGLILGCIFGLIHKAKTGDSRFAFGPYLSAGMALALVVGEPIANLYLQLCGTYPGMRLFSLCRRRNTLHVDGIVRHALVAPEEPLPGLGVVVVLRGKHLCADLYGVAVGQGVACLGRDGKVAHAAFVEQRFAECDVTASRTGFVQANVFAVFAGGDGLGGGGSGCCCGGLRGGGKASFSSRSCNCMMRKF